MSEDINMALRKFLKPVGVTSQQAIEEAIRAAGDKARGQSYSARMVLTIDGLDLTHIVEGTIKGPVA